MKKNIGKQKNLRNNLVKLILVGIICIIPLLFACSNSSSKVESSNNGSNESGGDEIDIQLIATSDMHGKFYPWDNLNNVEDKSGSLPQLLTAINERRNANTIIMDAGDVIQDNEVNYFNDDEMHPMVHGMNEIGYDVCTTGNHEYNYGMDVLKRVLKMHKAKVILGNVFDQNNNRLADPYTIIEKSGVKVGIVSAVTEGIKIWDKKNLEGWTVKNPVESIKEQVSEIKDKTDIIVALVHTGVENELGLTNSSARDIAMSCPEVDVVIASHDHKPISDLVVNNALIVENVNSVKTMAEIHIKVKKSNDGYKVVDKQGKIVYIKDYEPDANLMKTLEPYHNRIKEYSETVIGKLEGGDLVKEDEIKGIPTALIEDTALIELVNKVMGYYAEAKVSFNALLDKNSNLKEGNIRRCDISKIYKYTNTLYKVEMTGKQLKKLLEYEALFYNQYKEGDLTISFNKDLRYYMYYITDGVCYEIDISKPNGSRILNLRWKDGNPVKDDEKFIVASNNYFSQLVENAKDEIFDKDDYPEILKTDISGDIRSLIISYIVDVCGGKITNDCDYNWKIVGNNWDKELHNKAKEQINAGIIKLEEPVDKRIVNTKSITVADLK